MSQSEVVYRITIYPPALCRTFELVVVAADMRSASAEFDNRIGRLLRLGVLAPGESFCAEFVRFDGKRRRPRSWLKRKTPTAGASAGLGTGS